MAFIISSLIWIEWFFKKKNINSKIKRILKFVVMNQYSGVGNYYKSAMINCFVSQMVTSKNQSNILDF